ncbi:MAG: hypothetical protein N7Q72_04360, partial [Spiroplasma sp. Tabriz.8]|nr:hypothetical protein [Spiroplasma sp. Tabriz.8]
KHLLRMINKEKPLFIGFWVSNVNNFKKTMLTHWMESNLYIYIYIYIYIFRYLISNQFEILISTLKG